MRTRMSFVSFLSIAVTLTVAGLSQGGKIYDTADPTQELDAFVVPDLTDDNFDTLDLLVESNDIDTTLKYDLSFTGYDSSGTLSFVSLSPAIPGIAPAILTYSDLTAGTGPDGGHVTMNWFKQDVTPGLDVDALNTDWDVWVVTMGTGAGTDPRYATVAVPEPATSLLGGIGALCLLGFRRMGMHCRNLMA